MVSREQANARRVSSQTLYAKRGTIYDRNGTVLVSSIECKNVYVNPSLIKKKQRRRAIDALVDVLGMDEDVVEDLVDREGTFVYVKRQVDEEDAELLAKKGIAGIEFEPAIKRVYPNGSLASQVLGVVNVDNEGITGLEKQYNEVLTGVNGSLMRERARDGSFIAGGAYEKVPAQDGMDIVLGIDANVQRVAEDAIAEAVERVGATYGSVIVTDPTTGEIIAACSYPTYDPTDLASASNASMNLRVVTDVYEPGSVFKTFVSAAAIEHKGLTPNTTFDVPAEVLVGSDIVRDVDKRGVAMTMSLREILRRSSNTGMVLVGGSRRRCVFGVCRQVPIRQVHGHRFPGRIARHHQEALGIRRRVAGFHVVWPVAGRRARPDGPRDERDRQQGRYDDPAFPQDPCR